MKRVVALVAVLAVIVGSVLIGLWAVNRSDSDDQSAGRSEPPVRSSAVASGDAKAEAQAPPHANLYRFYRQKLTWKPCPDNEDFQCSKLTVPINYEALDSDTIQLKLLKVPAEEQKNKIGALVVNPGGPGAPGTSYAEAASMVFGKPIRQFFDIVGFDPRGTGESAPIDCLTDEELDAYLAADPVPDTPQEKAEYAATTQKFGAGCASRTGELIKHITTVESARDMDVLRSALGQPKLDYFGASYGTELGATYADLFPHQVGHLVLDGAVDVGIDSRQASLDQAEGFETALRAYVQNCLDSTDDCFLGKSVDEGLKKITDLVAKVDEKPLSTGTDRDLTAGLAFYGIVAPLYNRDYWPVLSGALRSALKGDGSQLLSLADMYASRGDKGYTDNSMEAFYAISCLDDPWAITPDQVPAEIPAFEKASPTFGELFAWGLTGCGGMQVKRSEPVRDIRGAGAAPILVIGTTRDPATPMKWAVALASQLESGVLLERDGDGHTGYYAGNKCVDAAVEDYLIDGVVPADGTKC